VSTRVRMTVARPARQTRRKCAIVGTQGDGNGLEHCWVRVRSTGRLSEITAKRGQNDYIPHITFTGGWVAVGPIGTTL
jgi:hypothetical protein